MAHLPGLSLSTFKMSSSSQRKQYHHHHLGSSPYSVGGKSGASPRSFHPRSLGHKRYVISGAGKGSPRRITGSGHSSLATTATTNSSGADPSTANCTSTETTVF